MKDRAVDVDSRVGLPSNACGGRRANAQCCHRACNLVPTSHASCHDCRVCTLTARHWRMQACPLGPCVPHPPPSRYTSPPLPPHPHLPQSTTRYVSTHQRWRLLLVPIFDMANHARDCPHHISGYDQGHWFHFTARRDLEPGEEVRVRRGREGKVAGVPLRASCVYMGMW